MPENKMELFREEELTPEIPETPPRQPPRHELCVEELSARMEKISGEVEELKHLYAPQKEKTAAREELVPYTPDSFWEVLRGKIRQLLRRLEELLK